jgi:DNA-binding NarL/FixJ family response regulator
LTKKSKISVLLVDDHALVRRGFRLMLEDDPEISIMAEAGDGTEAVKLAGELHPRVVVMDCALPGTSGMDATRQIRTQWPDIAVLMLTMHSEDTWVRQALDAGANGYILKSAIDLDLIQAVRKVAEGETVLDPKVVKPMSLKGEKNLGLTHRELEILQLIVNGKSNKEIASDLSLSVNTVSVHRANIMEALGIHNTAELVVYAIKNGLVTLS